MGSPDQAVKLKTLSWRVDERLTRKIYSGLFLRPPPAVAAGIVTTRGGPSGLPRCLGIPSCSQQLINSVQWQAPVSWQRVPALEYCPQSGRTCVYTTTPKKPNSALRKVATPSDQRFLK